MGVTPTKRQRSSGGSEQPPRLQIAKQYTPFGFHCMLEAPTAQWVRKDEDRCTYMNKGQFYGVTLEYRPKYNVSATAIRYLYRRNKKGITAKLDDDLLKFYCNEDTFLMQVTAIELEGVEGHESIMYDITLCELAD